MTKTLSTLFACGLLMLSGCGNAKTAAPASADPALWMVQDADTTIYLFGTVHVLKPDMIWFDDEVKAAFDRSDALVLEMVEPAPADMAKLVASLAFNAQGPTISAQLEEKQRAQYLAAMKREGLPLEQLDRFDPWMAAISLSVAPLERLGYSSKSGAEEVLTANARADGKRILGLETAEQQLGYFDTLPQPLQIAYLNATVDELPTMPRTFRDLITHWSRGNTKAIGKEMNASLEKTPELAQILLYQRNARWAAWIAQRMQEPGTVFVAVGAGHLAGKGSVQDDLAAMGLKAQRLSKQDFALK